MRRECTLCKLEFLSDVVQKYHPYLSVCIECEKAIVKIVKAGWITA